MNRDYNHHAPYWKLYEAKKLAVGCNTHHRYISECPVCHLFYTHDRRDKATCSDACKVKASRLRAGRADSPKAAAAKAVGTKRATIHEYACECCGREFRRDVLSGANVFYCSNACKQRAYRERKIAAKTTIRARGVTVPFPADKGIYDMTKREMRAWWSKMAKANELDIADELEITWKGEPEGLDGCRVQLSALVAHYYWWI